MAKVTKTSSPAAKLQQWIHPSYLDVSIVKKMAVAYKKRKTVPSLELQSFLQPSVFSAIKKQAEKAKYTTISFPDMFINNIIEEKEIKGVLNEFMSFLESKEFSLFLSAIAGKKIFCKTIEWCSFGHGQYTLLYDEMQQEQGVYLFFDCCSLEESCGGYTSIISDSKELACILPKQNTLTFFTLSNKVRYFTKYVNHKAGKKRRVVLMVKFK